MLLSCIIVSRNGDYSPSRGVIFGVYVAITFLHAVLGSIATRPMARLQTLFIFLNVAFVVAVIIALPATTPRSEFNSGAYIFGNIQAVESTWSKGFTFILAWLAPVWTIACFDSAVQ